MVSVGDVFCVKVGRELALCHVVAQERPRGTWDDAGRWRVVTCAWVGPRAQLAAALRRAQTFAPLRLTRLAGQAHVQSIGGPPPPEALRVATRAPSAAVRALRSPRSPGAWQWVEAQVKAELEYRAGPRTFQAKWAANVAKQKRERAAELKAARANQANRPRVLGAGDERARARLAASKFTAWKTHPRPVLAAVRAVVAALGGALGAGKSVAAAVAAVRKATRSLNRLDAKWDHPVTTPDAEELVEVLVGLAVAGGLDGRFAAQVVDEVREF